MKIMAGYSLSTPERSAEGLAERLKESRLAKGWKQSTLAERSGVSLGSLRRFEESGQISLESLLKLAFALGRLDDFDRLLEPPGPTTMAELEAFHRQPSRKRGHL